MLHIHSFCFNPFQENTYIVYNDAKQAIIIDPGMYFDNERTEFFSFMEANKLQPLMLLNTHAHLDHIFGNAIVLETYNIPFGIHEGELTVLQHAEEVAYKYGVPMVKSPLPSFYLQDKDIIQLGTTEIHVLLTPGHSPASVSFYIPELASVLSGDVLFENSIGRTDLPGGNYETLIQSVKEKIFTLPPTTKVYSGHGVVTTVEKEIAHNPFFKK